IFRKLLPRCDEIRKLVLRQCDCFSPVSLKSCELPESFGVRFGACFEKHSPLAEWLEVEIELMCLTVFIRHDFDRRLLHNAVLNKHCIKKFNMRSIAFFDYLQILNVTATL